MGVTASLLASTIETPIGTMLAVASVDALLMLEYTDPDRIGPQSAAAERSFGRGFEGGRTPIHDAIEQELDAYFNGELREFQVPIELHGTEFQVSVWKRLLQIAYGETTSYGQLAKELGSPDAQRAVGKANGDNRLAIVVPCHRVVAADGSLHGYGGGLWRKQRLLEIERGQLALL